MKRWMVVIDTLCDGWVPSCRDENGKVVVYTSLKAAEDDIQDVYQMRRDAWEDDPNSLEEDEPFPGDTDEGIDEVDVVDGKILWGGELLEVVECDQ